MAKVPLPDRGQPLDLSYIYQLADAVNNLSNELSPATARYTTIDTPVGPVSERTSNARIVGGYIEVTNSSTTLGTEQTFDYSFSDFAYVPMVTATPITTVLKGTDASRDVSVVLTSITTNKVSGIVKFNTLGVTSVGVNLLIVGIPV